MAVALGLSEPDLAQGQATDAPPVRLAVVSASSETSGAADLLTAELSQQKGIILLERDQIARVLAEQAAAPDYLKLGQTLSADGLLVLETAETEDGRTLLTRLVAVKQGLDVAASTYDFPLADAAQWSQLAAARFSALLGKLRVAPQDATPISILNFRCAVATEETALLEREVPLLLGNRLMAEPNLFVLDRASLEILGAEKELELSANPFWRSSFLVDGEINARVVDTNRIALSVQVTPPGRAGAVTVDVSGPRGRLTDLVNDLALKIGAAIGKPMHSGGWDPDAEAARYFEESRWMCHWEMFAQAKAAANAAWELGRQNVGAAEMRIEAYEGASGGPGECEMVNYHVRFGERGGKGLNSMNWGWTAPVEVTPEKLHDAVYAAELWLDGCKRFPETINGKDARWHSLGTNSLNQCSWWLRYYYFTSEARGGEESSIDRARQLCREMADILKGGPKFAAADQGLLTLVAKHCAFWAETPEQGVDLCQQLIDARLWPRVRERFFNQDGAEVNVKRQKAGYAGVYGRSAGEYADEASPRLAGWDPAARQRCANVWGGFVHRLAASSDPGIRLEGLILQCSDAWAGSDFDAKFAALLDYLHNSFDALADAGADAGLEADVKALIDLRGSGTSANVSAATQSAYDSFRTQFQKRRQRSVETKANREQQKEAEAALASAQTYLRSQTNFDFGSFVKILQTDFPAPEAKQLLIDATNYGERLTNNYEAACQKATEFEVLQIKGQMDLTSFWIAALIRHLQAAIDARLSRPTFAVTRAPIGNGGQLRPSHARGAISSPLEARNVTVTKPTPVKTISSARFWPIPAEAADSGQLPLLEINSACCRDGKLWIKARSDSMGLTEKADFFGVDLKTFATTRVQFQSQKYALVANPYGPRDLEVDHGHLYFRLQDSVQRFSFAQNAWESLPADDATVVRRLGDRLFFIGQSQILEQLTDGTKRVLASTRRRPALSPLDEMDSLEGAALFLDTDNHPAVFVNHSVYSLQGDNWQPRGNVPPNFFGKLVSFERGWLMTSARGGEVWGMMAGSDQPEILFSRSESRANAPAVPPRPEPVVSQSRWREACPSGPCCLEGDSMWFLQAPDGSSPDRARSTTPTEDGNYFLICFKRDRPDSMALAVDLSQQSVPKTPRAAGPLWSLTATDEGIVIARADGGGFWLVANADLQVPAASAAAQPVSDPQTSSEHSR